MKPKCTETPQALELQLEDDLRSLGPGLEDDRLVDDLYRALTRTRLRRLGRDGAVSFSFSRAGELLDELRGERGAEPLTLAQTGDEGRVSGRAADVLHELGWRTEPLNTSRRDAAHLSEPTAGEPRTEPQDSLARGHREADEPQPVPKQGTPGR